MKITFVLKLILWNKETLYCMIRIEEFVLRKQSLVQILMIGEINQYFIKVFLPL